MNNGPSDLDTVLESVVESLLLPVMPSEGAVLVTGDLTEIFVGYFEMHQIAPSTRHFTAAEIFAGAATEFSYADALVINDFRKADQSKFTEATRLLGYLRDRSGANILHLVLNSKQKSEWCLSDSLAMGFVRQGVIDAVAMNCALYKFNIKNYKLEPDWLNARNWAHPHLWR